MKYYGKWEVYKISMIPLENINDQTCFFPIWGPTEYKEMLSTKRSRQYIDINWDEIFAIISCLEIIPLIITRSVK